jgi:protein gp37
MDHRYRRVKWGENGTRSVTADPNWRQPFGWARKAREAGERRRVFCASLADVFEDRPDLVEPRGRLLDLIQHTPGLDWLLLTKRPENIIRLWDQAVPSGMEYPMPNVWLGTSVEDQRRADERIPELLKIPAAVRFLSVEPLLGPIDLRKGIYMMPDPIKPTWRGTSLEKGIGGGIDWVIIGGESGHGARPCDLAWIRSIVGQCKSAGVACFVKQLGAIPITFDPARNSRLGVHAPACRSIPGAYGCCLISDVKGGDPEEWPTDLHLRQFPRVPTSAVSP